MTEPFFYQIIFAMFRCTHDYVDVFTCVSSLEKDLIDVELHGRYCGGDPDKRPHLLISLQNIFIVSFNSDAKWTLTGFRAEFEFIDECTYFIDNNTLGNLCRLVVKLSVLWHSLADLAQTQSN